MLFRNLPCAVDIVVCCTLNGILGGFVDPDAVEFGEEVFVVVVAAAAVVDVEVVAVVPFVVVGLVVAAAAPVVGTAVEDVAFDVTADDACVTCDAVTGCVDKVVATGVPL